MNKTMLNTFYQIPSENLLMEFTDLASKTPNLLNLLAIPTSQLLKKLLTRHLKTLITDTRITLLLMEVTTF